MKIKHLRAIKIIRETIDSLNVDLSNLTVLTEVGSNNYQYTPVISALAGAEHVYAWTADTVHGRGEDIVEECKVILKYLEMEDKVTFSINNKNLEHIQASNVITNSGFIRPIDKSFLENINPSKCVIPLMYEAWELRDSDLDINFCEQRKIKVAGTWEDHPDIGVFSGVGPLGVKLALLAGYEVYRNNIIIWSSDDFGNITKAFFEKMGAANVIMTTDVNVVYKEIHNIDFIYFCDMHGNDKLAGKEGVLDFDLLSQLNNVLGFVHLIGNIDNEYIKSRNFTVFPDKLGHSSIMSESLAYLGVMPIVQLQVAGF